jgi:hypothetical protein
MWLQEWQADQDSNSVSYASLPVPPAIAVNEEEVNGVQHRTNHK